MYPLYKIQWLKQERPDLFARAARFITAKEYAVQKLTHSPLVDYSIASGSGLMNVSSLSWNPLAMDLAGVKAENLGQIVSPYTTFPSIDAELAVAGEDEPSAVIHESILGDSGVALLRCRPKVLYPGPIPFVRPEAHQDSRRASSSVAPGPPVSREGSGDALPDPPR